MFEWKKPQADLFHSYYRQYTDLVENSHVLPLYEQSIDATLDFLHSIPEERLRYRYAPEKWSILELVGHLVDTEQIFGYRFLRLLRHDKSDQPAYDENMFVETGRFDDQVPGELFMRYQMVKKCNLLLFRTTLETDLNRPGVFGGAPVVLGVVPFILLGHEQHHLNVLKERYLGEF